MSEITVKMFPAKNGDCFLVSLGEENKKHILIDCGYVETYNVYLKDELNEIADNNEVIDLMIISHVDQDHILGAIKLLQENNNKPFIKINEIWHNSYRHLHFNKEKIKTISVTEKEILNHEIRMGSSFIDNHIDNSDDEDISAKQGSSLASLILEGQYSWNKSFDGRAVNIDNKNIIKNENYTIRLLSPNTEKLNNLSGKWLRELNDMKLGFSLSNESEFDDAYEFYMIRQNETKIEETDISSTDENNKSIENIISEDKEGKIDNSPMNGSSISVIIEYNGNKLLFLADAHPDLILDSILQLKNNQFDLIKVSHHGSAKNTTNELVQNLDSELFLISTDGSGIYAHPDFAAMAKIVYHQEAHKKIFFNYETNVAKKLDNKEWIKMYNYSIHISDGSKPTIIKL
ncbi:hypothetical protein DSECCO2_655140 [anaerobic digester metagenome]